MGGAALFLIGLLALLQVLFIRNGEIVASL